MLFSIFWRRASRSYGYNMSLNGLSYYFYRNQKDMMQDLLLNQQRENYSKLPLNQQQTQGRHFSLTTSLSSTSEELAENQAKKI